MSGTAAVAGTRAGARLRRLVRIAILAVVIVLSARFLAAQDGGALLARLRAADPWLLLAAAACNAPLVVLKAARAQLLLRPVAALGVGRISEYYLASYAADNLLMSQAGVAVRVALLRRAGVPVAAAAALQALEKGIEGAGLLALLPLAPLGVSGAPLVRQPGLLLASGVALAALAALLIRLAARRYPWIEPITQIAAPLRRPRGALGCALLTLVAWATEVAMVLLTLRALHLPAALPACALVVIAVSVAALVPGLPANVGTFEAAAVVALGSAGVARIPSLGFALVYHALHTIPVTVVGLPGFRHAAR